MNHDLASSVLETQFGLTRVEVVHEDSHSRIVKISAAASDVVLELARSTFNNQTITKYPDLHRRIFAGHAMGKTFAQAGIDFHRVERIVRHQTLPPAVNGLFNSSQPGTVVLVDIFVGAEPSHYAQILEVYHPEVSWPDTQTHPEPDSETVIDELIKAISDALG